MAASAGYYHSGGFTLQQVGLAWDGRENVRQREWRKERKKKIARKECKNEGRKGKHKKKE
jgi:hypothetical protein